MRVLVAVWLPAGAPSWEAHPSPRPTGFDDTKLLGVEMSALVRARLTSLGCVFTGLFFSNIDYSLPTSDGVLLCTTSAAEPDGS